MILYLLGLGRLGLLLHLGRFLCTWAGCHHFFAFLLLSLGCRGSSTGFLHGAHIDLRCFLSLKLQVIRQCRNKDFNFDLEQFGSLSEWCNRHLWYFIVMHVLQHVFWNHFTCHSPMLILISVFQHCTDTPFLRQVSNAGVSATSGAIVTQRNMPKARGRKALLCWEPTLADE